MQPVTKTAAAAAPSAAAPARETLLVPIDAIVLLLLLLGGEPVRKTGESMVDLAQTRDARARNGYSPRMLRTSPRVASFILFPAIAIAGAGCIKRQAPPPAAVGSTAATTPATAAPAASDVNAPNPVQEAANARIAGLARVDL